MLKKIKRLFTDFFVYIFCEHNVISTILLAIGVVIVGFVLGYAELLYENFLEFAFENYTVPAVAILIVMGFYMTARTVKIILKMEKSKREELKKKVFEELILLGSCILIVVVFIIICINIQG